MTTKEDLQNINFGQRVAEEETNNLGEYFVETDDWRRVFDGEIDVIYGTKGAGKSAIYTILDNNTEELFDKNILLTVAENPRGATVFEGLSTNPPTSEVEFIRLWKLYFVVIANSQFENWGIKNKYSIDLKDILGKSGLIPPQEGLKAILKVCFDYVRKIINVESFQQGVDLNEVTGMPSGVYYKVTFREPNKNELDAGIKSVEYLLELLDNALKESGFTLWVAIDRLDVAFTEDLELETNALKALFKVYRDLSPLNNLKIKIFLRDDIWRRLTEEGFREASHITKTLTIQWSKETIVNLIIRRLLSNESFVAKYSLNKIDILSEYKKQEQLFYRFFPDQIEVGDKKSKTIEWILGRLQDGKRITAPREIIHLFNEAKQEQIKKIEIGQNDLEGDNLIGRNAFKIALSIVSKVRLEQTIYAEYPSLKPFIQKLELKKTEQRIGTLAEIWSLPEIEAQACAKKLVDIGFFEKRGDLQDARYWVPFIYRNELKMIQGAAE
jgi:hypothetical protein